MKSTYSIQDKNKLNIHVWYFKLKSTRQDTHICLRTSLHR